MPRTIKVPGVRDLVFCYATPALDSPNPMVHCDRKKNHQGKHSWEYEVLLKDFQAQVLEIDRLNAVCRAFEQEMAALRAKVGGA